MSGLVVKSYDGRDARRVVAGMAVDPAVCGRIASRWTKEGLFGSPECNLVGGWCVRHYRKFGRPPGPDLRAVFDSWAASRDGRDGKLVDSVGRLLRAASDERESDGSNGKARGDFVLDLADRLFRREAVRRAIDSADADLEAGDVDAAESRLAGLRRLDLSSAPPVRPGLDRDFWRDVFDEEQARPLFEYPGPLGAFVGSEFSRDSFVAVMAPAKRFKSWFLLDAAFRCLREHHRVAFFEAGDLSKRQVGRRMGQRALRRPKPGAGDSVECRVPSRLMGEDAEPEWDTRRLEPITEAECHREWARLQRGHDLFRLSCHSNRSLSVAHVEGTLREWSMDGWSADAVVIDYADILAPPAGIKEGRDQINENWMGLRRISQDHDCLVLTATQADAASYGQRVLRRHNFSDDRRKHDHVTAMVGINMTDEEKGWGVYRLNFLDRRESAYTETSQIRVAGCLEIGCPVLVSAW